LPIPRTQRPRDARVLRAKSATIEEAVNLYVETLDDEERKELGSQEIYTTDLEGTPSPSPEESSASVQK
jgi:hypothetical protein